MLGIPFPLFFGIIRGYAFLDFIIGIVTINDSGSLTIPNVEARHLRSVPGLVIPNGGDFSTTNEQLIHHSISRRDQCGVIMPMIELSCGKFINVTNLQ